MTVKEKVLKVWPDAHISDNYGEIVVVADCSIVGESGFSGDGAEEAAWQNAAESLPAQPQQKVVYDAWGKAGRLQPAAPVEAKDKDRCEHGVWLADRCYQCVYETEKPVAEPKPTPSTESLVCPHGVGKCVCRICNGIQWDQLKPQPDSSSIPDETDPCKMTDAQYEEYIYGPNRAEWPTNQTAAPPDSSTISTEQMPAPLIDEQILDGIVASRITPRLDEISRVLKELQQWRKWAKGQSNGR